MRTKRVGLVAILGALLATGALLGRASAEPGPGVGDKAPAFKLPKVDGSGDVDLEEVLKTSHVILLWISPKCPYSRACDERFEQVRRDFAQKGISVIGINSNKTEGPDDLAAYAKRQGWSFPLLYDKGNVVADAYGATRTPEAVLIEKAGGTIAYRGRMDDNVMESRNVKVKHLWLAAEAVLAGKAPETAETKPQGCSIKRVSP